jgi:hypothetical protein
MIGLVLQVAAGSCSAAIVLHGTADKEGHKAIAMKIRSNISRVGAEKTVS